MQDFKAKEAARASTAAALAAAFPHLVPIGGKVDPLNAAAKNIRIELKLAFPGIKFSVKSSRFSMGDSIDVSWTDGPNCAQVNAIVCRYKAGSFDGMTDCYEYSRSAWTDAFGDTKYLHTSRTNSDIALSSAARTVRARRGVLFPDRELQELIYQEARRRTWVVGKALPAAVCRDEVAA